MKRILLISGLLVLFCLMLSCKKGSPTEPTTPTITTPATPKSVIITSPNTTIRVGQTEQFTATVTMSDNTTKAGYGTWGSDAPNVATVSQSGLVTGISAGNVTIYFDQTGDGRGTKLLTVRILWSKSGVGDDVFDMPTYVQRVKITGTYTGYASNFIVHIGGNYVVNELLGTGFGQTYFSGTYLTTGGVVEILHSSGVAWSFTEVIPATTMMRYPNVFGDQSAPPEMRIPSSFGNPAVLPEKMLPPDVRDRASEAKDRQKIKQK